VILKQYKRVFGTFSLRMRRIDYLRASGQKSPFAATLISYQTEEFTIPSDVYGIYSMFFCYYVAWNCDLGIWPSFTLRVFYTMPAPRTNFDYPIAIGYWVTITQFDHIDVIWNSHCACAVSHNL